MEIKIYWRRQILNNLNYFLSTLKEKYKVLWMYLMLWRINWESDILSWDLEKVEYSEVCQGERIEGHFRHKSNIGESPDVERNLAEACEGAWEEVKQGPLTNTRQRTEA